MPRRHRSLSVALLLPGLVAVPAAAQVETWRATGDVRNEFLGHAVATVADYDGDGTRDVLVGAPGEWREVPTGRVLLLSGTDLSLLREFAGPLGENFGAAVADAGDVDGDGVADLFVGSEVPGVARVYSGATGVLLLQLASATASDRFGASAVGLGDVDGDGLADLAIGAPGERVATVQVGVIRIVSGANGATLRQFDGSLLGAQIGDVGRMANAGDFDGDGVDDLAYLDVETTTATDSVLRVVSGATGAELFVARKNRTAWTLETVAHVGDLDGDGVSDYAVGGMPVGPTTIRGRVFVLSGGNGGTLLYFDIGLNPSWVVVGSAGDVDGDSVPDVAAASTVWSWGRDPIVMVVSGATGANLDFVTGTMNGSFGRSFASGVDADGDGQPDIVVGESTAKSDNVPTGETYILQWPTGKFIARHAGSGLDRRFRGDVALLDDFDGDGANDFAVADVDSLSSQADGLRIHSGRDGSLLLEHLLPIRPYGELVAVPDLDGDGHDDLAFGEASQGAAVEVRSSATAALLLRITGGSAMGFVEQLAVGVQPGGAIHLAIGAPTSSTGTSFGGEVQVWDLSTGTLVFQRTGNTTERLGSDLAWLGDVNGDGVGDWALGAPYNDSVASNAGRVVVASGIAGGFLKSLTGAATNDLFGSAVAGPGDLDGDGLGEVVGSAPKAGSGYRGEVQLYAGGTWTLMATISGSALNDHYGNRLDVLPDLNGDGLAEWLAFGNSPPHWDVRSGAAGTLLARLPAMASASSFTRAATPHPWQVGSPNGDAIADVLFAHAGDPPGSLSQAWLVALDDLLLQIDPPFASAGDTVTIATRGGPAGGPAALEFVAFGGLPVGRLIDLGTFDPEGVRTYVDFVPPVLAGLDAEFRGWAIGFDGRVVSSPMQTLTFQ